MSNYLAIAAVTASIKYLLGEVSDVIGKDVEITSISPNSLDSFTRLEGKYKLNVFLYHVTSNASFRNSMFPSRNSSGELVNNTQIGLELYYLLTAYSPKNDEDQSLISQRILADAIRILNENPILTFDIIDKGSAIYLKDIPERAGVLKILQDLSDQKEPVKIGFHNLSLEELSKIWTSFFQTSYCISVAYHATVVLLDSKQKKVKSTIPVEDRLLYVEQFKRPLIKNIIPSHMEWALSANIEIIGQNLKADLVKVRFNGVMDSSPISIENISNDRIVAEIPEEILSKIGRNQIQVVHPVMMGIPAIEHKGFESNIYTINISPKIISMLPNEVSNGDIIKINFQPPISAKKKIAVLFGDQPPLFPTPTTPAVVPPDPLFITSITLEIPTESILPAKKEYLVRLQIDNEIESLLQVDNDKTSPNYRTYIGPKIKVR